MHLHRRRRKLLHPVLESKWTLCKTRSCWLAPVLPPIPSRWSIHDKGSVWSGIDGYCYVCFMLQHFLLVQNHLSAILVDKYASFSLSMLLYAGKYSVVLVDTYASFTLSMHRKWKFTYLLLFQYRSTHLWILYRDCINMAVIYTFSSTLIWCSRLIMGLCTCW